MTPIQSSFLEQLFPEVEAMPEGEHVSDKNSNNKSTEVPIIPDLFEDNRNLAPLNEQFDTYKNKLPAAFITNDALTTNTNDRKEQALRDVAYMATPTSSERKSYLNHIVGSSIEPILNGFSISEEGADEIGLYTRQLLKLTPLFMRGKGTASALAGLFALDEASPTDTWQTQLIDAGLGAGKGVTLKETFRLAQSKGWNPALTGLNLGVMSRFSDSALTRANYYDNDGFSITTGMSRTLNTTLRPEHLVVDAIAFGAADVIAGRLYAVTRGRAFSNPVTKSTIAGGTMGFMSGGGYELSAQMNSGDLQVGKWVRRTGSESLIGAISGGIGGAQARRTLKIEYNANTNTKTDSLPETGRFLDKTQQMLREGKFELQSKSSNLTTETWVGRIITPDGRNIPAIFRPSDGSQAFQARMLAETTGYTLNKGALLGDSIPASVAKTVEIGGQRYHGFVQEMRGIDLGKYLQNRAREMYGRTGTDDMVNAFRADPLLQKQFGKAMTERMILGEWDNHALNMLVTGNANRPTIKNIDLADSLKPATLKTDLIPDPGFLKGWEGLNAKLYREISGKPIPPEMRSQIQDFVRKYDTPDGRKILQQQTGWNTPQMEGVLGRSKWFADQGYFAAPKQLSLLYPLVGQAKRLVKGTLNQNSDSHRLQQQSTQ